MLQLLHPSQTHLVLATGSSVSVVNPATSEIAHGSTSARVLSVSSLSSKSTVLVVATTDDKTAYLWKVSGAEIGAPVATWKTGKKCTASCIVLIDGRTCVLLGDKVGEVWCYDVSDPATVNPATPPQSSLLLGHTASIITSMVIAGNVIYTSDRDECIRRSEFPETHIVEGYLLGHTGAVTSFAAPRGDGRFVASAGADMTVRVWTKDGEEVGNHAVTGNDKNPASNIAISPDSSTIVFTRDDESSISILAINEAGVTSLTSSVSTSGQPVSVSFLPGSTHRFAVLVGGGSFVEVFELVDGGAQKVPDVGWVKGVREMAGLRGEEVTARVVVDLDTEYGEGASGFSGGQLNKNAKRPPANDWNMKKDKSRNRSKKKAKKANEGGEEAKTTTKKDE